MTGVLISPTKATLIVRLPAEFACAWSPGFDLHVSGTGETEEKAREELAHNLRVLGVQLLDIALQIETGEAQ